MDSFPELALHNQLGAVGCGKKQIFQISETEYRQGKEAGNNGYGDPSEADGRDQKFAVYLIKPAVVRTFGLLFFTVFIFFFLLLLGYKFSVYLIKWTVVRSFGFFFFSDFIFFYFQKLLGQ